MDRTPASQDFSETAAVVPSVILCKLVGAGPGNVLSRALRKLGRIELMLGREVSIHRVTKPP